MANKHNLMRTQIVAVSSLINN